MSRHERKRERFIRNLRKTLPNKICAIALIILGLAATAGTDDATALVFLLFMAVPLFFARERWIF